MLRKQQFVNMEQKMVRTENIIIQAGTLCNTEKEGSRHQKILCEIFTKKAGTGWYGWGRRDDFSKIDKWDTIYIK